MRPADVLRAGAAGLRYRRTRTLLSALGIAIGVAALVSVRWPACTRRSVPRTCHPPRRCAPASVPVLSFTVTT
jgi:hypothetical protein